MLKRFAIFGATGRLGSSWLGSKLVDPDSAIGEFYSVVRDTAHLIVDDNMTLVMPKFCSAKLKQWLVENDINCVINTAGFSSVDGCELEPERAYYANAELPGHIAGACSDLSIKLVHISTDHLYTGRKAKAREEETVQPINIYGLSKALGETRVRAFCPDALIIRTNFFGRSFIKKPFFSDWIIDQLSLGREVELFGNVFFSPILDQNLISTVHELINKGVTGVFNVCCEERISKFEFGQLLASAFQLDHSLLKKIDIEERRNLVKRPYDMSLDNGKVCTILDHPIEPIVTQVKLLVETRRKIQ